MSTTHTVTSEQAQLENYNNLVIEETVLCGELKKIQRELSLKTASASHRTAFEKTVQRLKKVTAQLEQLLKSQTIKNLLSSRGVNPQYPNRTEEKVRLSVLERLSPRGRLDDTPKRGAAMPPRGLDLPPLASRLHKIPLSLPTLPLLRRRPRILVIHSKLAPKVNWSQNRVTQASSM